MARIFTARYPGRCAACGEDIDVGENVTYLDDQLVHDDCAGDDGDDGDDTLPEGYGAVFGR